MPGTVFSRERLVGARMESDALRIGCTVGKDAWVKSLPCAVGGGRLAFAVDVQRFAANAGRPLWYFTVMGVASGPYRKPSQG